MKCYKCGATLSIGEKCPQCGARVDIYKRAVQASNVYYNAGLAKAQVRDLTGAVDSLKTSISIHKHNIEARNLLGLVYYEMGDIVEALGEWVISKNFQQDNNPANVYITQIQSSQNKFEMTTNMIKKYNQSLHYTQEGNYDMAMIQLKKVVSQMPKLIKAQLLLSLLYIREKEYAKAKKHSLAVLKIDRNNTLAQRYLNEIEQIQLEKKKESSNGFLPKKKEKHVDETKPLNGNDVIMPKSSYKEPSNGGITVINILVGVVIGAALIWFLVMPSKFKGITEEYNNSIAQYSEKLSSGNVQLDSLTQQVEEIQSEKEALEEQLADVNGDGGSNKLLTSVIQAANYYIANDKTAAAEALIDVEVSSLPSDAAKSLYTTISDATMTSAATEFYTKGTTAYNKSDYETAVDYFVKAYKCDSTKTEAAYYAAKCYVALNETDEAKEYYQYIVDDAKTSTYYSEAKTYVDAH